VQVNCTLLYLLFFPSYVASVVGWRVGARQKSKNRLFENLQLQVFSVRGGVNSVREKRILRVFHLKALKIRALN